MTLKVSATARMKMPDFRTYPTKVLLGGVAFHIEFEMPDGVIMVCDTAEEALEFLAVHVRHELDNRPLVPVAKPEGATNVTT